MKATMTISPASESRKVRTYISARVVNRLATFTAVACVAGAWTCALLDKDTACAVTALVGFIAVMAAQKEGGEL